jgi:hypothetical protein
MAINFLRLLKKHTPNDKRMFYIHVGKCGGTSIADGLAACLGAKNPLRIDVPGWRSALEVVRSEQPEVVFQSHLGMTATAEAVKHLRTGTQFITGHIPLYKTVLDEFESAYKFATVLRDPVDRVISSYCFRQSFSEAPDKNAFTIQAFLNWLDTEIGAIELNNICYYFGGNPTCSSNFDLNCACEILRRIPFVGFLDNLDSFANEVARWTGKRPRFKQKNKTIAKTRAEFSKFSADLRNTPDIVTTLRERSKWDYELYNFAKQLRTGLREKELT